MPWVNAEKCTGCNVCIERCPIDAISMENKKAKIDMDKCIRCGTCHSVCPNEAVRHDSEKIPDEIKANVEETKKFMELCVKYLGDIEERNKCLQRMMKHYNKERIVAEKTMEELEKLKKGE
ncbi:MAG: 4Fe-4S binding protein [Candidatus Gygaella obscura]|nr:4Fe-4S binding protein [Candidatus Gygaella obscura]